MEGYIMELKDLSLFQLSFLHESMDTLFSDGDFIDKGHHLEVKRLFKAIKKQMAKHGFTPEELNDWIDEENNKWRFR